MYTSVRRLAAWLGSDKSVSILDYGCGTGAFIAFLRDQLRFVNLEGIEVNQESIGIARRNFDLKLASSRHNLQHGSYDYVLLLEVIEHVPCPDNFFKQVAELVKPGGRVLITTPAVDNLSGRFLPSCCRHYTALSHVSLFTSHSIMKLLSRFGFEVERLEVDHYGGALLEEAVISGFYKLDFMSPRNDDDVNDVVYKPNALERLFREDEARKLPFSSLPLVGRLPTYRANKLISYFADKVLRLPQNDHLYILARRKTA